MRPRRGSVSPVPRNLFVTMAPAASEGCYGRGRGRMTDVLGVHNERNYGEGRRQMGQLHDREQLVILDVRKPAVSMRLG
jgi:hypothetical protein